VSSRWLRLLGGVQRKAPWGVALTFDDGPSPASTPALLDLLRSLDVRATFFMRVDDVVACPDLVLRMQAEGHGVATSATPTPTAIEAAMVTLQLVLDRRVRTFRPDGPFDRDGAMAMRRARADAWLWTVDASDGAPDAVQERDVVRMRDGASLDEVRYVVELIRANDLDFIAL
jgi:peptidoglycan/xylan/chitin deacetylase (PgdA/CDA1 family)